MYESASRVCVGGCSSPGMLVCVSEVKASTNMAHMVDTPRRHGERGKQ